MKKKATRGRPNTNQDELRPEYDFTAAVRGAIVDRYRQGKNVFVVDPDVLPDVLAPGLAIVFCGSAAGTASARRGAYYAGPGNAFWPTLFEVGLTHRRLEPEEYQSITKHGLGLTDLAKTISGSDRVLAEEHFDREGLRAKILRYRPRVLAFTSKRAAEEFLRVPVDYGRSNEKIGDTALFVLPSPSGAGRRFWDAEPWRRLARLRY